MKEHIFVLSNSQGTNLMRMNIEKFSGGLYTISDDIEDAFMGDGPKRLLGVLVDSNIVQTMTEQESSRLDELLSVVPGIYLTQEEMEGWDSMFEGGIKLCALAQAQLDKNVNESRDEHVYVKEFH